MKRVRMVRCTYRRDGEPEMVPMGRARTRCPRCGALVRQSTDPRGDGTRHLLYHVVFRREADS